MTSVFGRLSAVQGIAMSLLRVVTGVMLAWHGYRKFADGLDGFEGFLSFLELPAPGTLAVVVALLELVGGIALVLGLLTRPVALLFVFEFGLIFLWVKLNKLDSVLLLGTEEPAVELDLLYLTLNAFFLTAGPGPLSADHVAGLEQADAAAPEPALSAG